MTSCHFKDKTGQCSNGISNPMWCTKCIEHETVEKTKTGSVLTQSVLKSPKQISVSVKVGDLISSPKRMMEIIKFVRFKCQYGFRDTISGDRVEAGDSAFVAVVEGARKQYFSDSVGAALRDSYALAYTDKLKTLARHSTLGLVATNEDKTVVLVLEQEQQSLIIARPIEGSKISTAIKILPPQKEKFIDNYETRNIERAGILVASLFSSNNLHKVSIGRLYVWN